MKYVTEAFSTHTFASTAADANTLPIVKEAYDDLLALLDEDETYTYATLKDDSNYETVKLYVKSGTLLMDRGQAGTSAVAHPCGTCVSLVSPTTIAALKDLICQWDCCESDCPCEEVSLLGKKLPTEAKVGTFTYGHVLFGGTQPIAVVAKNAPSWMEITIDGNLLSFEGTPESVGTVGFIVAAANCNGNSLCVEECSFEVAAE